MVMVLNDLYNAMQGRTCVFTRFGLIVFNIRADTEVCPYKAELPRF
jgi:hypothetical protein